MLFSVPRLSSIIRIIRGTTTAGDTALSTAPIKSASMRSSPSKSGAKQKYPRISMHAGTNDIITAGRPTFFKSARLSVRPARIRIIISAICLS